MVARITRTCRCVGQHHSAQRRIKDQHAPSYNNRSEGSPAEPPCAVTTAATEDATAADRAVAGPPEPARTGAVAAERELEAEAGTKSCMICWSLQVEMGGLLYVEHGKFEGIF